MLDDVILVVALWLIQRVYPVLGFEKVRFQFHGRRLKLV
jgi:hypothetical protein